MKHMNKSRYKIFYTVSELILSRRIVSQITQDLLIQLRIDFQPVTKAEKYSGGHSAQSS